MSDRVTLGHCCSCNTTRGVRNIVLLPWKCEIPGHGWGCLQCGLSANGGCVVLCDGCMPHYDLGEKVEDVALQMCRGYPGTDGREPFYPLKYPAHVHDMTKHPEAMPGDDGR